MEPEPETRRLCVARALLNRVGRGESTSGSLFDDSLVPVAVDVCRFSDHYFALRTFTEKCDGNILDCFGRIYGGVQL
jgi:hypothetical protein